MAFSGVSTGHDLRTCSNELVQRGQLALGVERKHWIFGVTLDWTDLLEMISVLKRLHVYTCTGIEEARDRARPMATNGIRRGIFCKVTRANNSSLTPSSGSCKVLPQPGQALLEQGRCPPFYPALSAVLKLHNYRTLRSIFHRPHHPSPISLLATTSGSMLRRLQQFPSSKADIPNGEDLKSDPLQRHCLTRST